MSVNPVGTTSHSPQAGETLTFRSTRESSNGDLFRAQLRLEPGTYVSRSQIHPLQEERFVVQKLAFPLLVPVGKLLGLRARYARYGLGKS